MSDTQTDSAADSLPSQTSAEVRNAVQELLKYGLLEADRKRNLYRIALTYHEAIQQILEPLDFSLKIDEVRGLAFLLIRNRIGEPDNPENGETIDETLTHPLVRRQRLNMEQTLLLARLRQLYLAHEQDNGIGAGQARTSIEELVSDLEVYLPSSGSQTRDENRVRSLLEQLRSHSLVTEPDENGRVGIRPIITHVASPESLLQLLAHYKRVTADVPDTGTDVE